MREIVKSLGKRKLSNLLIFLQIFSSFVYFFMTAAAVHKAFHVYAEVPKALNTGKEQIIVADVRSETTDSKNFQAFCEELMQERKVEKAGTYHNTWLESERINHDFIDGVEVTHDMDWLKSVEVTEGRGFEPGDFDPEQADGSKKHPLPLLAGQELVQKYSLHLGEQMSDFNGVHYEVVGVLKRNSRWFMQTIPEGLSLSMDNQFMIPISDGGEVQMHYYFKISEHVVPEVAKMNIQGTANKRGIDLSAESLAYCMDERLNEDLRENMSWLCFSILILIMISVGLATLILARMYARKREIGIRTAVGYTMRRICFLFVGEVFVLVLSALLVAVAVGIFLMGDGTVKWEGMLYSTGYTLTLPILLASAGLGILMCIPPVAALFVKFRKLQPKDLIGGNE